MTSHLEPSAQSPVVMKQDSRGLRVDDECARGDVARKELIPAERGFRLLQQFENMCPMTDFEIIGRNQLVQSGDQ